MSHVKTFNFAPVSNEKKLDSAENKNKGTNVGVKLFLAANDSIKK